MPTVCSFSPRDDKYEITLASSSLDAGTSFPLASVRVRTMFPSPLVRCLVSVMGVKGKLVALSNSFPDCVSEIVQDSSSLPAICLNGCCGELLSQRPSRRVDVRPLQN